MLFTIMIGLGILLRLYVATNYLSVVYPDEHYQTLEPASWALYGFGWKSWEWYHGIRSWFVPSLYMPLLALLKFLGFIGGPTSIYACRLLNALINGIVLYKFHRFLIDRKLHPFARFCAVLLFSFSSAMVVWSATTFAENWAMCFLWISLPLLLNGIDKNDHKKILIGAMILGLTFMARIQMTPWALGFGLCLFMSPRGRKVLPTFIAGYAAPVLAQGVLDWATWGYPFYSAYKNIVMNLMQGVADSNGRSPWYAYGFLVTNNLGLPLILALTGMPAAAAFQALRHPGKLNSLKVSLWETWDLRIILPALIFVFIHALIGHKETRFLLPAFPVLFYLFALSLNYFITTYEKEFKDVLGSLTLGHGLFLCALLSVTTFFSIFTEEDFNRSDVSDLALKIREDGLLRKHPDQCLLFVNHYWIWARGEMLQGHPVKIIEVKGAELKPEHLAQCAYAIMPGWESEEFQEITKAAPWQKILQNPWGHVLFKNNLPFR